jgi:hypothetical protein
MTKKAKGLSFDEKKQRLTTAMNVDASFYNFKEIEVIAKKNGIVPQSVKEVLDCLIADRVVIQEKIGSLNMYAIMRLLSINPPRFWAFSSNEIACLENQVKQADITVCNIEVITNPPLARGHLGSTRDNGGQYHSVQEEVPEAFRDGCDQGVQGAV